MSYTKQNFTDGSILTAAHLNHMEEGIANAEQTGGTASLTIGTVTTGDTAAASITEGRLNLTLPRGVTGPAGEKGEKGDTGPGFTDKAKSLILELFAGAAYGNAAMQTQLDALKTEWGTSGSDSSQNTNPFPSIEAAYLLPKAKTFVPSAKEYIDTGIKMFENETPGNWTILLEMQAGTNVIAKNDTYVIAHCMEESGSWPGFVIQEVSDNSGTFQVDYYNGKGHLVSLSKAKSSKVRIGARLTGKSLTGIKTDGVASWGTITSYTTVNKTLILGAYQASDGTKGRFFDGTLYQCIVYNSALTDDQIKEWLAG